MEMDDVYLARLAEGNVDFRMALHDYLKGHGFEVMNPLEDLIPWVVVLDHQLAEIGRAHV